MALYYELPVYKDTYKLILKIFEFTKDFSREYKYTIGNPVSTALSAVRRVALKLLECYYLAKARKKLAA